MGPGRLRPLTYYTCQLDVPDWQQSAATIRSLSLRTTTLQWRTELRCDPHQANAQVEAPAAGRDYAA